MLFLNDLNTNILIIGIDIGGSHCTAAVVDLATRSIVPGSEKRQPVNSKDETSVIIQGWSEVIRASVGNTISHEVMIGIAMPGPFDYEEGISLIKGLDKYENLYGLNVKLLLAESLGIPSAQIRMNNDAACFLQGEMFAGAGRGYKHSVGITLGTGAGSAIHHQGKTMDANLGPSPFLESIADNYLSTRWFVGEYKRQTGTNIADVRELVSRYQAEPVIKTIFSTFATNLSLFLRNFILREKADIVVMGGNISRASDYFLPEVEQQLRDSGVHIPIVKATLGEEAIILGAASLFS